MEKQLEQTFNKAIIMIEDLARQHSVTMLGTVVFYKKKMGQDRAFIKHFNNQEGNEGS